MKHHSNTPYLNDIDDRAYSAREIAGMCRYVANSITLIAACLGAWAFFFLVVLP